VTYAIFVSAFLTSLVIALGVSVACMTLSAGELWQIILSILAGPTVLVGWIIAVHIRQTLTRIELKAALKGLIHDRFRSRDQTISKPSCANGGIHTWHLDEMAVLIAGRQFWLWHAVDDEGEVLDLLVQRRRDESAAVKLMHKLLKKQGFPPAMLVTDKLRSYGVARSEMGLSARHEQGLRKNNRAENSHQPTRRRERKIQRSKSPGSAQRFLSVHAAVHNTFNVQCHLTSRRPLRVLRDEAFRTWRAATAA
jgi:transposase-like protein